MIPFEASVRYQPPLFPAQEEISVPSVQHYLRRCRRLSVSMRVHPTFQVSQLKPVSVSNLVPPPRPHPPLQLIDDHVAFTACRLLDVRCRGPGLRYLVDWEGYGPE